jgi:hypothetical protein
MGRSWGLIIIISVLLTACATQPVSTATQTRTVVITETPIPTPTQTASPTLTSTPTIKPTPTETQTPEPSPTPTSLAAVGPERSLKVLQGKPLENLTTSEIKDAMDFDGSLPEGFRDNDDVKVALDRVTGWLVKAGFNTTDPKAKNYAVPEVITWMVDTEFRWNIVVKDASGNISGWLKYLDFKAGGMLTG